MRALRRGDGERKEGGNEGGRREGGGSKGDKEEGGRRPKPLLGSFSSLNMTSQWLTIVSFMMS